MWKCIQVSSLISINEAWLLSAWYCSTWFCVLRTALKWICGSSNIMFLAKQPNYRDHLLSWSDWRGSHIMYYWLNGIPPVGIMLICGLDCTYTSVATNNTWCLNNISVEIYFQFYVLILSSLSRSLKWSSI